MKTCPTSRCGFALATALLVAWSLGSTTTLGQTAAPSPAVAVSKSGMKFKPQVTGAPSVRVTGGSRGTGLNEITLDVLAPDDIGTTTFEAPSLFWFQSKPADAKFELTLLQENKAKPLVQVKIDRSSKAGIQRLKLSDHGVKLAPGIEYQWVVALVTDSENRSSDLVASGVIKRIVPSSDLAAKISAAKPSDLARVYAEAGIWYDSLTALSDQIDASPDDKALKESRADLLGQVGLKTAAANSKP